MHVTISIISDSKYVWRKFAHFVTFVHLNLLCSVDWQNLIWIDCHQN